MRRASKLMRARLFPRESFFRAERGEPAYVVAASESVVLFGGAQGVRCQSVVCFLARVLFVYFIFFTFRGRGIHSQKLAVCCVFLGVQGCALSKRC